MNVPVRMVFGVMGMLALAACVTINIYFPAAAAEQAADRIIDEVWGTPGRQPAEQGKPSKPGRDSGAALEDAAPVAVRMLEWAVPAAQAAEPDINIRSPAIDKIKASMKARHGYLAAYYGKGAIGLTRNALIAVRDLSAVPLKERNRLKKQVADENRDRNALYREIARVNGHPEWEQDIRRTFARRWVEKAPKGWWYQDADGNWVRKH